MSANTQPRYDRAQTPEQSVVIARLQHGFAAHLLSEPLVVTRWLMYGQARLYVKTQQGSPIGWVDVRTGERMIEVPELQPAFETAIAAVQPGIPQAYTPRRALLQSVEADHRPKGDGPAPMRAALDLDAPVWTPVDAAATSTQRHGRRPNRTPRVRPLLDAASPSATTASTAHAVGSLGSQRFGHLDALADRYQLRRGGTATALVARQLNTLSRRTDGWDYLAAADLGIDDAAVDFMVGGPGGVFAIDVVTPATTSFPGAGFAKRAGEVLSRAMETPIWVRHLLIPVGFTVDQAALLPGGLPLISRRQLSGYLTGQPDLLEPADVELALGYARLRWTWRS